MTFKIGLTGGIGSGKSTIATLFESHAIPVIDADIIARQLVEPGKPALSLLQSAFGESILNQNHSLNRDKLRELVFCSKEKKQQLEAILHPLIYQQMQSEVDKQSTAYSILAIPLLIETKKMTFVDRILVVDCPVSTQIQRVQQRDLLSNERILSIISTQVSRQDRLALADDIIDNTIALPELAEQVKKLHNYYLSLSTPLSN